MKNEPDEHVFDKCIGCGAENVTIDHECPLAAQDPPMTPYPPNSSDVSPATDVRRWSSYEVLTRTGDKPRAIGHPQYVDASDHAALLAARDARIAGLEREKAAAVGLQEGTALVVKQLEAQVAALTEERDRLLEGATQAHKLLGSLRPIDIQNATVRDSVGAAYCHINALLASKAGEK